MCQFVKVICANKLAQSEAGGSDRLTDLLEDRLHEKPFK